MISEVKLVKQVRVFDSRVYGTFIAPARDHIACAALSILRNSGVPDKQLITIGDFDLTPDIHELIPHATVLITSSGKNPKGTTRIAPSDVSLRDAYITDHEFTLNEYPYALLAGRLVFLRRDMLSISNFDIAIQNLRGSFLKTKKSNPGRSERRRKRYAENKRDRYSMSL